MTRGLSTLGKPEELYDVLLISIILGKLPRDVSRNLAHEHRNVVQTFIELKQSVTVLDMYMHTHAL